MNDFDRIKPPERRLLERPDSRRPDAAAADPAGRAALFSAADRSPGPSPGSTLPLPRLRVECSHCGMVSGISAGKALRKALPLTLLAPWRSHPVFAICPCGERRAWLRPSVGLRGGQGPDEAGSPP